MLLISTEKIFWRLEITDFKRISSHLICVQQFKTGDLALTKKSIMKTWFVK